MTRRETQLLLLVGETL
jgi:hypothetical protein